LGSISSKTIKRHGGVLSGDFLCGAVGAVVPVKITSEKEQAKKNSRLLTASITIKLQLSVFE